MTRFVVLAIGDAHAQAVQIGVECRGRARSTDWALHAAGSKSIPVLARRLQAGHLDVHRVGPIGRCEGFSGADDASEAIVGGQLPSHGHCRRRHASVRRHRLRR